MPQPIRKRSSVNFEKAPYIVLWELTRACALACRHCRARANRSRSTDELSIAEAVQLLDELNAFGSPLIVLTGGDPVERPDLFEIIAAAKMRGFTVAITPSATPRISENVIRRFKDEGVDRVAVSIDGATAGSHDGFRRVSGSFDLSMNIARWCQKHQLPLQINTTVSRYNIDEFDSLTALVGSLQAALFSVFFLVPTGRATVDMQISAAECEDVMHKMTRLCALAKFDVKATAAPHFRRVLLESLASPDGTLESLSPTMKLGSLRSYRSVNDGNGTMFISHTGDVYPSGFLPVSAGNVRNHSVVDLYRRGELFRSLRDPELLKGKCGSCKYKVICGGSRARAYAETGDYLGEDSLCAYQ